MTEFAVAVLVSAIDPIVAIVGVLTGYFAFKRFWQTVGILAVFAVIGLIGIQTAAERGNEVYYAFAQICAVGLIAAVTFLIAESLPRKKNDAS